MTKPSLWNLCGELIAHALSDRSNCLEDGEEWQRHRAARVKGHAATSAEVIQLDLWRAHHASRKSCRINTARNAD
jgi:hypothetical protein